MAKKKVAIINGIPYGSTGTIARGIKRVLEEQGTDVLLCYSWTKQKPPKDDTVWIGSLVSKMTHMVLGKMTGFSGCFGAIDTLKLIRQLKAFDPDVVNLHILHCWNVNLPLLFSYLKKHKKKVIWTMHDCWAFTGQCVHYTLVGCDRWKTGCHHCSQYRNYPQAYVDNTKTMWRLKRKWFTCVSDMVIVTPSEWMKRQVEQSFLNKYPIQVINNGIDLEVFHPTDGDFREKYHLEDKFIVLGVAMDWGIRKGKDLFIELAKMLDPSLYQIVMIGVGENEREDIPENVICINRTANRQQMAEIYSAADVLLNPTREDNFPTVNIEALACGTPVVTFNTGGSPEILDETCGRVTIEKDITSVYEVLEDLRINKPITKENCIARASLYDMESKFNQYAEVIRDI